MTNNLLNKYTDNPTAEQKNIFENIMKLYDISESMLNDLLNLEDKSDPNIILAIEFVEEIEGQIEDLLDNYLSHVKKGGELRGIEKIKVDKARFNITNSIENLAKRLDCLQKVS